MQTLGDICSDRLGFSKVALGVAVLRGVEAQVVPENYLAESLPALVARVLYRLRYLSEQSPFDAGTFAYAAPLVSKILRSGGIGLDKSDTEAALEQLALALDFISFHARQCAFGLAFHFAPAVADPLHILQAPRRPSLASP